MKTKKIVVPWLCLIMIFSFVVIIIDIVPMVEAPSILEVDDSGGKPYTSIQAAVNDAQPGDTVFVYAGTYYEDVTITITINLTGENRDTTIINSTDKMGIYVSYVDYVNISGFKIVNGSWAGIRMMPSNNSLIENNRVEMNQDGIQVLDSSNTIIKNNIVSNNTDDGMYLGRSINVTVENNKCLNNDHDGIYIYQDNYYNKIIGNNCSYNAHGIYLTIDSKNNFLKDNVVIANNGPTLSHSGLFLASDNNTVMNLTSLDNKYGVVITSDSFEEIPNYIINSTISNSIDNDVVIGQYCYGTFLNTTFNKTNVKFADTISKLENNWYLHINVIDYYGNPVPNANVKIEDNKNSSNQELLITDGNGYLRWLIVTEYIEIDPDGDEIGEKTYHTPHKIVAWNDTLVGYAQLIMNESKTVTIVLYNGTLIDLEPGWNLISLPRIQSNTNLPTVLQSIEGQYDAVQWYNITDSNDPWKHNHISKPSNLNDLNNINHTMGLWVHVTDPGGTTLVVFGDMLTSTQNISLYPGWNLVGYPSTTDKIRISALNNIFFDTDVDAIWTYNATTQTWKEITASDNFEVGRGYWMHSKVTKTWIVPL